MATPQEVKANIVKLVNAGAPEEDVDAYVKSEGFTAEELKAIGNVTPTEEGGMVKATPEQLAERARRNKAEVDSMMNWTDFMFPLKGAYKYLTREGNVPLSVRAGESIKITPEGKAGYLQSKFGPGQVVQGPSGPSVYDPAVGEFLPVNKPVAEPGDIAGMAGPLVSSAPNIGIGFLGPLGASPLAQGGAGVVGETMRQGLSAMIPGEENLSPTERLKRIGLRGAQDFAMTGLFKYGAQAYDAMRPHNALFAKPYQKVAGTDVAIRGREANRQTTPLTLADETRAPHFLSLQKTAMQSEKGKVAAEDYWRTQTNEALGELDNAFNMKSAPPDIVAKTATKLSEALNKTSSSIKVARTKAWDESMNEAVKVSGGQPIISPDAWVNTRTKVAELIQANPATASIKQPAITVNPLASLKIIDKPMTALEVKELMKQDLPSFVKNAIREDLKSYAKSAPVESQAAMQFIDKARKSWGIYSQKLTDLEANSLSSLLKIDDPFAANLASVKPEVIVNRFSNLSPTEFNTVTGLLRKHFPEDMITVKQALIQRAKDEALTASKGMAPEKVQFSIGKFIRNTLDDRKYNSLFTASERQAIADTKEVFNRVRLAQSASGDVMADTQRIAEGVAAAGGAVSGQMQSISVFGPKFLVKWFSGPYLAKRIFDPKAQEALRIMKHTKPGTVAFNSAASILVGNTYREPSEQDVSQQLPEEQ